MTGIGSQGIFISHLFFSLNYGNQRCATARMSMKVDDEIIFYIFTDVSYWGLNISPFWHRICCKRYCYIWDCIILTLSPWNNIHKCFIVLKCGYFFVFVFSYFLQSTEVKKQHGWVETVNTKSLDYIFLQPGLWE